MIKLLITLLCFAWLGVGCSDNPKTVEEYLLQAETNYKAGEYFKARRNLGEAIKLKPSDKEVIYQLGRNYSAEHMYDSSFAHLSRADKLYPNDRRINLLLHEVCVKTERWAEAIQALLSLTRTGDPIEMHYHSLAEYARKANKGQVAEFYYGKLIEIEPDSMNHYIYQAQGALVMEQPEKSIEILNSAVKRFGDQPKLLSDLGKYYSLTGDLKGAERVLRILVSKDSSILNQLNLATALAFQESRAKKEEALSMFKKLRNQTPDVNKVDSMLSKLENELKMRP